jgi:hypothetical protein
MTFPIGTKVRMRRDAPDVGFFENVQQTRAVVVAPDEIAFVVRHMHGHHGSSGDDRVNNRWYINARYLELDGPPPKLEDYV